MPGGSDAAWPHIKEIFRELFRWGEEEEADWNVLQKRPLLKRKASRAVTGLVRLVSSS